MNYVLFSQTFHEPKQFQDKIMPQDDFVQKYGKPDVNGMITIGDEIYSVLLMNSSLADTLDFMNKFRSNHIQLGYKNLS